MKLSSVCLLVFSLMYSASASANFFNDFMNMFSFGWKTRVCTPKFTVMPAMAVMPAGQTAEGNPLPAINYPQVLDGLRMPFLMYEVTDNPAPDEELRAQARAIEAQATGRRASAKLCDAAKLLLEIIGRYPVLTALQESSDESGIHTTYAVATAEPSYYVDVAVNVARLLLETRSYNQTTDFIRSMLVRLRGRAGMEELQFLYAEAFFRRIPKDPALDETAANRALQEYTNLDNPRKFPANAHTAKVHDMPGIRGKVSEVDIKVMQIFKWKGQHELAIGKSEYFLGQWMQSFGHFRLVYNPPGTPQQSSLLKSAYGLDVIAEAFYYTCRAMMRVHEAGEAQKIVAVLTNPQNPFLAHADYNVSKWAPRAQRYCGTEVQDPKGFPEKKFDKQDKEHARREARNHH